MIYLTGDTHGVWKDLKFRLSKIKDNSKLIVLGDFGFIFDTRRNQINRERKVIRKKIDKICSERNLEVLFVDGNHENFPRINMYEIEDRYNGKVNKISNYVFRLRRGETYNIDNNTFFVMGGADSIDRIKRIYNVDWWKEEVPNREEYENGMVCLDRVKWNVDYILTHTIHDNILQQLSVSKYKYGNSLNEYFEIIDKDVEFKHWYFGHMHTNKTIDNKYTCLYEDVIILEEGTYRWKTKLKLGD